MRNTNEIFFLHIRFNKDGSVYDPIALTFNRDALDPYKGITVAFQLNPPKEGDANLGSIVTAAYARCHSGNALLKPTHFNKKDGRDEATKRLLAKGIVKERIHLFIGPNAEGWPMEEVTAHVRLAILREVGRARKFPNKASTLTEELPK